MKDRKAGKTGLEWGERTEQMDFERITAVKRESGVKERYHREMRG